jgi:beta-glucosidase
VDVKINERTLREVYLPHFKRCIDEGAASIMSAYNKVNQIYCGHHHHLLRGILKEDWDFRGFVISDFVLGVRDAAAAVNGGLDIEMPFTWRFGKKLRRMLKNGIVSQDVIDEAVLRILRQKIRFAQIGEHERYGQHAVASQAQRALAREAAQKSMVLLKNDGLQITQKPLLPLEPSKVKQIAVIGKLARMKNTGDRGSSMVRPPYIVTPLEGLQKAANGDIDIAFNDGERIAKAVAMARQADIVIIVVGYTHHEEGEYIPFPSKGGDRDSLRLRAHDEAVIKAIVAENPSTVVVLIGGSAIVTEPWREATPAILMAWYPGMEGGHAMADILFGKVNPSGKLPCIFPKSESQLPYFDKNAKSIEYGYYHGYRLMDKEGELAAFPFGFGLSYTTFEYQNLCPDRKEIGVDGTMHVKVDISNTGHRVGEEIAQLYVGYINSTVERPVKTLKGFFKVKLEPQETKTITFALPAQQLAYYDEHKADWVVERIAYMVYVGPSSSEDTLLRTQFHIR